MHGSLLEFPIVLEHQPGYSRRRQNDSTLVRAHVMSTYHRDRKTHRSNKATPSYEPLNLKRSSNDATHSVQNLDLSCRPMVLGFEQYVSPATPSTQGKLLKSTRDSKKKQANNHIIMVKEAELKRINLTKGNLQLRDPREIESLSFGYLFKTYSMMLEDRETPLDILSETWLPIAFTDLAFFHAITFNFSQHLYSICSIDHENPSLLQHKVLALRHISTRMESPRLASSDAVIASILCLISHELLIKDVRALGAHIRGLRKIIELRGGLDALGLNNTLKAVYLTYELLLSTSFRSWWTASSMLMISRDTTPPLQVDILTCSHKGIDLKACGLDGITIEIGHDLNQILSNHNAATSLATLTGMKEKIIYLLPAEDTLISCGRPGYSFNIEHFLWSLLLTLHLDPSFPHFPTVLPAFPTSTPLINQLKYHLNLTCLISLWHPIPGALLWCLVVGVEISEGTPEHSWFVANLMRTVTALALVNWNGVRSCMNQLMDRGTFHA